MIANKTKIPVSCSGDVLITRVVGKRSYDIKVNNALCVPELTTYLLSVSQLIKKGNTVKVETSSCKIYNKQSELIAIAELIDNVYKLNVKLSQKCLLAATVTGMTWHRRLGHLDTHYLNVPICDATEVEGLFFNSGVNIKKGNCTVCCEGKQSRLPFKYQGSRANKPLEVIHTDVCGPMENRSIGGSKYFLILEEYTNVFCLFPKDKR